MSWVLIIVGVLALLLFAAYRWALANDSVALLDNVDGIFTSGDAELVAESVLYGDDAQQSLYIHREPDFGENETRPVLVWIHGGAWRDGDPKNYGFIARNLAAEGFVVVNAGYRKSDSDGNGGQYPEMLEDGAATLRWITDNIGEYGGDPSQIYLMGHSAGAYNAVMLALDAQWIGREGLPVDTVKGVIGLAGPYDFLPLDSDSTKRIFGDVEAGRLPATQPVNLVSADAPPMLLLHGGEDTVVKPRHSVTLAAALNAAGSEAKAVEFAGQSHSDMVVKIARPFDRDDSVKGEIIRWLAARADVPAGVATRQASAPVQAENR